MEYSTAIVFPLPPPAFLLPSVFVLPSPFFSPSVCDGLVFSHGASTPLATGDVCSGICAETQIRKRAYISGQWALDACNAKPIMEVSSQTDILMYRGIVCHQTNRQHKHAHQHIMVITCRNDGTENYGPLYKHILRQCMLCLFLGLFPTHI